MSELRIEQTETGITAFIKGEIDHHTARDIREKIDAAVHRMNGHQLLLDMSGITFMDSSGIGLILGRYRLMQALQGNCYLVNVPEPIDRLVRLAGVDTLPIRYQRKD